MHFHSNKTALVDNFELIQMNEVVIVQNPIIKFLGIYLDQHLDWKYFYKELANKLKKNLNIIGHLKHHLDHRALQQLKERRCYKRFCRQSKEENCPTLAS